MSNIFANLKTDGLEKAEDRLGGFNVKPTDLYTGKIKALFKGEAASGAQNFTLIVDLSGQEYRETIYVTNKKGENFFLNKQDTTKKVPLPGFTIINDICLVTTGAPLAEQAGEEKVVNVYDPEQKKEVPKSVPMVTGVLGLEVSLAIVNKLENKQEKDGSGNYHDIADTREVNNIEKVFHTESKMTVYEAEQGKTAGEFWDLWVEKNKGVQRDARKIKDGSAGKPGTPPVAGGSSPAPRTSLFGKK